GLLENGITTSCQMFEMHTFALERFGGSAEQCQARYEFQSVHCAYHQLLQSTAPGELVTNRTGDFFVASAQKRITQIGAGLREIVERISARGGGPAKASQLREDVPDPVARLPAASYLRQRGFIADR